MAIVLDILKYLLVFIAGAAVGFFVAKHYMQKFIKANPPINEEMIKALMSQMGRTPSQKQVNQMMKNMEKYM